jgi:hypothetical protein
MKYIVMIFMVIISMSSTYQMQAMWLAKVIWGRSDKEKEEFVCEANKPKDITISLKGEDKYGCIVRHIKDDQDKSRWKLEILKNEGDSDCIVFDKDSGGLSSHTDFDPQIYYMWNFVGKKPGITFAKLKHLSKDSMIIAEQKIKITVIE